MSEDSVVDNSSFVDENIFDTACTFSTFSPVFLIGFSKETLTSIRNAYRKDLSTYDTHFYSFDIDRDTVEKLSHRVGITPKTIILAKHVPLQGPLRGLIRIRRIPVLRVLEYRCPLAELPKQDYYGRVYETISESNLTDPEVITASVDLGIRIYGRDRDQSEPLSMCVKRTIASIEMLHTSILNLERGTQNS